MNSVKHRPPNRTSRVSSRTKTSSHTPVSQPSVLRHAKRLLSSQRARQYFGVLVLAFLLANIEVAIIHSSRTFPHTSVAGHHLGAVAQGSLSGKIDDMPLLPETITLKSGKTSVNVVVADLGIKQDTSFTAEQAMQMRSWLPIISLFSSHDVPLQVIADANKTQEAVRKLLPNVDQPATNAKIIKQGDSFSIKAETNGVALDVVATADNLLNAIVRGKTEVVTTTKEVKPEATAQNLQPKLTAIQNQLKTGVTLQYDGRTKKLSAAEMKALFTEDTEGSEKNNGVTLSAFAIQNSVITAGSGFGIGVQNLTEAVTAIQSAITSQKSLTFTLKARPFGKVYSYCTATRGVDSSQISDLNNTLKSAFTDSRGWNLGGLVSFQAVSSGCDFTVWLSSADQMSSFGTICDAEWSCTVSPNVIINYDRWRYTTDPWKKNGGSLQDYRIMAINHETGHWLGFNHSNCSGSGQPAPVMQQQSIDLQGCVFNPWPTASEQNVLKARLGL